MPENDLFSMSERGWMSLDETDATVWTPDANGRHRWFAKAVEKELVGKAIDAWMIGEKR